jgi:hypothetical protein
VGLRRRRIGDHLPRRGRGVGTINPKYQPNRGQSRPASTAAKGTSQAVAGDHLLPLPGVSRYRRGSLALGVNRPRVRVQQLSREAARSSRAGVGQPSAKGALELRPSGCPRVTFVADRPAAGDSRDDEGEDYAGHNASGQPVTDRTSHQPEQQRDGQHPHGQEKGKCDEDRKGRTTSEHLMPLLLPQPKPVALHHSLRLTQFNSTEGRVAVVCRERLLGAGTSAAARRAHGAFMARATLAAILVATLLSDCTASSTTEPRTCADAPTS